MSENIWDRNGVYRRLVDHLHGKGRDLQRADIPKFIPKKSNEFPYADRAVFAIERSLVGYSNSVSSHYSAAVLVGWNLRVIQFHCLSPDGHWRNRGSNLSTAAMELVGSECGRRFLWINFWVDGA